MTLSDLLASRRPAGAGFSIDIPESWTQGRTVYGGLSAALCLQAALDRVEPERALRSALVSFVGPASESVEVTAEPLRSGRNATSVRASLAQDGAPATEALFTFAAPRPSQLDRSGLKQTIPPPGPEAAALTFPPAAPAFTARFEFVPVFGGAPFSGAAEPDQAFWVRHRDRAMFGHPLEILSLADALPPAIAATLSEFRPVASMTWMIDLLAAAPSTEEGWWLLRSRADHAADGFSSQDMTVWNAAGEMIARGRQMVAVFA